MLASALGVQIMPERHAAYRKTEFLFAAHDRLVIYALSDSFTLYPESQDPFLVAAPLFLQVVIAWDATRAFIKMARWRDKQ